MNVTAIPDPLTKEERAEILVALDAHLDFWRKGVESKSLRAVSELHVGRIKSAIAKVENVRGRW